MSRYKMIVHCSDSPQGRGDTAETIHRWHKQKGFDGIGYHYVILEDGTIEKGRPEYWPGAHARGHNEAIGVCLIGIDEFTETQFSSLRELIKEHDFKEDEVAGHYKVSVKSCPNFDVEEFMETVYKD